MLKSLLKYLKQDVAGMGCFSLGIFAQFASMLRDRGTVSYRRLHWGAGAIGHLLYLQGNLS